MRRILLALAVASLATLTGATHASGQDLADYDYEYLAFRGVGLDVGYVWANKVRNTEQVGLRFDLGYLGPGVRIIPSIGYWRSQLTQEELDDLGVRISDQVNTFVDGELLGPIEWSDLYLSIDGNFVWNTPLQMLAYVGAGLGFHALNGQGAAIDDTIVEDLLDAITAGVSGIGGVEFQPVDRLRVYAEGRYTAMNSIQFLSLRGGLQVMFSTGERREVGAVLPAVAPEQGTEAK